MHFELDQRGRASMDFIAEMGRNGAALRAATAADAKRAGLSPETLVADLDERRAQIERALATSKNFRTYALLSDWGSTNHGRFAIEAFEQARPRIEPKLQSLKQGPCTLEVKPGYEVPEYVRDVEIHRTTGGWDGHEYMGFIHGELIHRHYVAKTFPGDIFAQRRRVLDELPARDFPRILEMGASSGHYTRGIQDKFPNSKITGVDTSVRFLEQAQRVANEHGWPWRLIVAPGEDTGLPSASFDLVTSYILLHEIPERVIRGVFAEAFRVLAPGGYVLMTDVTPYWAQDRMSEFWADWMALHGGEPYWRESASLKLDELCREIGFVDAKTYGLGGKPYPWITIARKPEAA
jgi:SAM-dependent methyltransferase/lambda repressor-like predicted transcriptional regulator